LLRPAAYFVDQIGKRHLFYNNPLGPVANIFAYPSGAGGSTSQIGASRERRKDAWPRVQAHLDEAIA
jgi:hypothetical protein